MAPLRQSSDPDSLPMNMLQYYVRRGNILDLHFRSNRRINFLFRFDPSRMSNRHTSRKYLIMLEQLCTEDGNTTTPAACQSALEWMKTACQPLIRKILPEEQQPPGASLLLEDYFNVPQITCINSIDENSGEEPSSADTFNNKHCWINEVAQPPKFIWDPIPTFRVTQNVYTEPKFEDILMERWHSRAGLSRMVELPAGAAMALGMARLTEKSKRSQDTLKWIRDRATVYSSSVLTIVVIRHCFQPECSFLRSPELVQTLSTPPQVFRFKEFEYNTCSSSVRLQLEAQYRIFKAIEKLTLCTELRQKRYAKRSGSASEFKASRTTAMSLITKSQVE